MPFQILRQIQDAPPLSPQHSPLKDSPPQCHVMPPLIPQRSLTHLNNLHNLASLPVELIPTCPFSINRTIWSSPRPHPLHINQPKVPPLDYYTLQHSCNVLPPLGYKLPYKNSNLLPSPPMEAAYAPWLGFSLPTRNPSHHSWCKLLPPTPLPSPQLEYGQCYPPCPGPHDYNSFPLSTSPSPGLLPKATNTLSQPLFDSCGSTPPIWASYPTLTWTLKRQATSASILCSVVANLNDSHVVTSTTPPNLSGALHTRTCCSHTLESPSSTFGPSYVNSITADLRLRNCSQELQKNTPTSLPSIQKPRFTFDTLGTPYGVVGLLRGHIKGNRQTTSEDLAAGNPKKPSPTMFSPLIHDRP